MAQMTIVVDDARLQEVVDALAPVLSDLLDGQVVPADAISVRDALMQWLDQTIQNGGRVAAMQQAEADFVAAWISPLS